MDSIFDSIVQMESMDSKTLPHSMCVISLTHAKNFGFLVSSIRIHPLKSQFIKTPFCDLRCSKDYFQASPDNWHQNIIDIVIFVCIIHHNCIIGLKNNNDASDMDDINYINSDLVDL